MHRQLTGRKHRAIEPARVREVKAVEPAQEAKPIENVNSMDTKTPTEKQIPWRAPRSEPDPGTYACRTISGGCITSLIFLASILFFALEVTWYGVILVIAGILCLILTIKDLEKSRGGW